MSKLIIVTLIIVAILAIVTLIILGMSVDEDINAKAKEEYDRKEEESKEEQLPTGDDIIPIISVVESKREGVDNNGKQDNLF